MLLELPYYTQGKATIKHIKYLIDKFFKNQKVGKGIYPLISPHILLYLVILNLKVNASAAAPNHFALKEIQPKVYGKCTDVKTNQWRSTRLCLCLSRKNELSPRWLTPISIHLPRTAP